MVRQRHHKHDAKRASDLWPARGLARPNRGLVQCPICPFLSTLIPAARCNKASGVCSIRRFLPGPNSSGSPVPGDKIVTVCPSRFLQTLDDGKSVFVWISEKMLDVANPTVIKETPFFAKFRISYAPRKRRQT